MEQHCEDVQEALDILDDFRETALSALLYEQHRELTFVKCTLIKMEDSWRKDHKRAELDKRSAYEYIKELKVKLGEKPEALNKLTANVVGG